MNKLISCIIPMYNAKETIELCIQSVIKQTYTSLEIIVVDDGSTDQCAELVKNIAKRENRVVLIQSKNQGVSAARNLGLRHASGDYIFFLDSDDSLPHNTIEILMKDIITFNAEIAIGKDVSYSKQGKIHSPVFSNEVSVWQNEDAIVACLKDYPYTWNVCGKLFSKKIVEGLSFCEGRNIGEDSWFFFECCLKNPTVSYRDECVYNVYMSHNSATRSSMSTKKINDILFFADQKLEVIEKELPKYIDLAINIKLNACLVILNKIRGVREFANERKALIKFVRKNKKFFDSEYSKNKTIFQAVIWRYFWLYSLVKGIRS